MAIKETFETGTVIKCRVAFTDPDNGDALIDPTTVTIAVKGPGDATATTYTYGVDSEVEKESAGNYLFRLSLAAEGTHHWKWTGTTGSDGIAVVQSCDAEDSI